MTVDEELEEVRRKLFYQEAGDFIDKEEYDRLKNMECELLRLRTPNCQKEDQE